ncbi:tRNA-dihydrouridine synthase [Clostridia bacterium]|nr:tRNA-dihydrouridine synthase [Clostridia bacterium]
MIRIGNREFGQVFLAPMAGVTDRAFRVICRNLGADLTSCEMVSAAALGFNNQKTLDMLKIEEDEKPCSLQLFGSDPLVLAKAAERITERTNADILDLNFGCPAQKIVKNGEGSALMQNPALAERIVREVVNASRLPVTVKIRRGYKGSDNAAEIAKIAEIAGAAAVTVHPRTREQLYSGKADWAVIAAVRREVKIPVIGNGDIISPQSAKQMFEETNCGAVMVGRSAIGNPWIFRDIKAYLETGELLPPPDIPERIETALYHLDLAVEDKGDYIGILESRRHLCAYIKGIAGAADAKMKINNAETVNEIKEILWKLTTYCNR